MSDKQQYRKDLEIKAEIMGFDVPDKMFDDMVSRVSRSVNIGIHPSDAIQAQYKRMKNLYSEPQNKQP